MRITVMVASMFAAAVAAVAETAVPVAEFGFEEVAGAYADDGVSGQSAELTPSAKWASGTFGGALATGEKGAGAFIPNLSALDGTDNCTLFLRFRKSGSGFGRYPNLLTSSAWGAKGGMMLFSPEGKALSVRFRAGGKGPEAAWTAFAKMPQGKWSSVAFVFNRPNVTVYANGEPVANGKWDHPFATGGAIQLGGWMADSFGGFIDDLRVWKGALDPSKIAELAGDSRYDEIDGYQDDGTGGIRKTILLGQGGSPALTLDGDAATLVFDTLGCISSIREKATGRELVSNVTAFVSARLDDGRMIAARRMEKRSDGKVAFAFGKAGEVVIAVSQFKGGWSFAIESSSLRGVKELEFCRVQPVCGKWKGDFANAWSDEKSSVCVRSYDIKGEPRVGGALRVSVDSQFPIVGRRAGLAAGPRDGFREQLKAMTVAAGVPRSDAGGAWSMDSDVARWSYVFTSVVNGDIDSWIEFVKRAGFANLHLNSSWTDCLGQCPVNRRAFPGGIDEMKSCAEKAHVAGLHVGMHTLTACICPRDPWITPLCSEDLVADATYTLAAPLSENAKELLVNEKPIARHVNVFTYSSNGNVLRIGNELIQYTGIDRERKPYAFTGLKRGAFGTRKGGVYPAGTKADYLHQRYIAFYPKPDSELAEKLASRLAEVYNTCNLDEFYFDGSEGMGTRYGIDAMRHKIYAKLKPNNGHSPSIEASCGGANNWWFQTRMATVDHGVYGVKRFHDWHIGWAIDNGRYSNFLEPQMGWWQPRTDVPLARGHMLDEMEYFAGKNAGFDAAMSLQGISPRQGVTGVRRQLTVLGWYEWPRLARAFAPEARQYLASPRSEARLRQNAKGVWELADVETFTHRAGLPWQMAWTVESAAARPAAMRVEALYSAGPATDGEPLLTADMFKEMKSASAKGVKVSFDAETTGPNGKAFRLSAENVSAERNGAWARAEKSYGFNGVELGGERIAFGAWVKGDGSGALLNLQFTTPGAFGGGISDHYVRLDFDGWCYVTVLLRERDAASYGDFRWPYGGGYANIYRNIVKPGHLGTFSAYLNDVPQGKRAAVEIGEVMALNMVATKQDGITVMANGAAFKVPFELDSGEYAELDDGCWTHYSAMGNALGREVAAKAVELKAGANGLSVSGGTNASIRAEVTLFAFGRKRPAFVSKLTPEMKKTMRYEGVMPFEYAPAKGLNPPSEIPVRPGEKASLSVELYGPAANPTFTFRRFFGLKKTVCQFEADIADDERLVCRDGTAWSVEKLKDGTVTRSGSLKTALPVLGKTTKFTFAAGLKDGVPCVVDVLKEYR